MLEVHSPPNGGTVTDPGEPQNVGREDPEESAEAEPTEEDLVPPDEGLAPEPVVYRPDSYPHPQELDATWLDEAVGDPNPYNRTRTAPSMQPDGWFARTKASVPYYLVTMTLFAAVFWLPYISAHGRYSWVAAVVGAIPTAFGVTVIALRIFRGSVADSTKRMRENLERYLADNYHNVSNRLQHKLTDGEVVTWETALHPVSILHLLLGWLNKNIITRGLTGLYLVYVIGLVIAPYGSVPTMVVGLVIPVALVAFAISDWRHNRYAVTNLRIMAVVGMVTIADESIRRATITSLKVVTPWQANFLAWLRLIDVPYGTWIIETPAAIEALVNPSHIPAAAIVVTVFGLATEP